MENVEMTPVVYNSCATEARCMLYLGGDKTQHIGYVSVYNGVNVIEYTVDRQQIEGAYPLLILPIGNSLKEQSFGAFDRNKHTLPY